MATRIQWFNRHMPNLVAGDWQTRLVYPNTIGFVPPELQAATALAIEDSATVWLGARYDNGVPIWAVLATWPGGKLVSRHLFRQHWQYQAQLAEAVAELT